MTGPNKYLPNPFCFLDINMFCRFVMNLFLYLPGGPGYERFDPRGQNGVIPGMEVKVEGVPVQSYVAAALFTIIE